MKPQANHIWIDAVIAAGYDPRDLPDGMEDLLKKVFDHGGECARLEDEWQPIETAPKDGTHFLAYEPCGDMYRAAYHQDGYIMAFGGQPVVDTPEPTHWMPLLEPPTP